MSAHQKYYQQGVTLIELMIAIAIGLVMLTVLAVLFAESTRSHKALSESSQQIENGRFAIQVMADDLHLAGFYGRFSTIPTAPTTLPDPCAVSISTLYDGLPFHIQGFSAANFTSRPSLSAAPLCAAILTNANLQPGSDILVVRRADTSAVTTPTSKAIYIQANPTTAELQVGTNAAVGTTNRADGTNVSTSGGATVFPTGNTGPTNKDGTAAPIRQYHVSVYFVAPCSLPNGGGLTCTGASDDGGNPIPTLKRLVLSVSGSSAAMTIDPLVEGIEMMKVDYGVDTGGGLTGTVDGVPDGNYLRTVATVADWANVMGVDIYLLSRNPQSNPTDASATKTYNMGISGGYTPCSTANTTFTAHPECFYKRHAYSTTVRLTNASSRRETP